jgi:hypothetical protein
MLLSLLATDNLSEVAQETPGVAALVIGKKSQKDSPFAEDSTLLAAMTLAIADVDLSERISAITVFRKISGAILSLSSQKIEGPDFGGAPLRTLQFIGPYDGETDKAPAIHVQARLAGHDLSTIATALAQEEWQ